VRNSLISAAVAAVWLCLPGMLSAAAPNFEVTLSPTLRDEPFTGRVYVFTSRTQEPRRGPDWFHPEPFLARDVVNWTPGEPLSMSADDPLVLTFPRDTSRINWKGVRVQAVARLNRWDRNVGTGAGNAFSPVAAVDETGEVTLTIDQLVPERTFEETRWSRLLSVRSKLLSDYHGRDVLLQACVTLPASYFDRPQQRYPVILDVPGFGGTHAHARRTQPVAEQNEAGVEFLRVTLDPSCPLGHHVFADSANNGPVGQALIEEFLPELDRRFRTVADARARFLTGHSSGGWSTLWLQVTYPDSFGGVWSTAPDPVDFRDFQRINLYEPGVNMYVDENGNRRPLAIVGGQVAVWYDDFAWMEYVLGHGGQLHSFEAVFSPRSDAGHPELLWNRETGEVDTDVARSWEAYDIRLVLERNWDRLQPQLAGKLNVFMGSADTFLLEGATRLLGESLERVGSDAVVEIHEGKDHGTLLSGELRSRIRREMTAKFLTAFPDWSQVPATVR
jgi:pimeloyl-ACP methyl ester carboxylesterase